MKKLFILGISLTILCFFSCARETDKTWNKIKKDKKIIIGIDEFFPPLTFKENEKFVGIDIELAEETFKRLRVKPVFKPVLWKDIIFELTNGSIDIIWSGLSVTDERKKTIEFSLPYIETKQVIVVNYDSEIDTKEDLRGKVIGVQKGSTSYVAIQKDTKFKKSIKKLKGYVDVDTEFSELKNGKLDAIVIDEIAARYFLASSHANFKILSESLGYELFAVGLRKEDKILKQKINFTLQKLMKNGTEAKIFKKWLGETKILSDYLRRIKGEY